MMGRSEQTTARPGLGPHRHGWLEVCLIERGQVNWFVEENNVRVSAGDVFVTQPGQLHGNHAGVLEPCRLSWLQVDPRRLRTPDLTARLLALDVTRWPDHGRLRDLHERMMDECRFPALDSARMMHALLIEFLITLVRQAAKGGTNRDYPEPLARAVAAIHAQPAQRWTLDELREIAGVGSTWLHTLFRTHLGQSPAAYAMRQRLREAHRLLRDTDRPILDIALDMHFSSSQHFATAFRKQFGVSPRDCRQTPGL